jgi:hypothetical protein
MQEDIHKKLFRVAESFFNARPWDVLDNEDVFGLSLKGKNELCFVCIMGGGGMEYGALFMKGWEGYKALSEMADDEDDDALMNTTSYYSVSLSHKDDVHPKLIKYHKRFYPHISSKKPFPCFMVKEPLKVFKVPTDKDAELLCLYLKTVIELEHKGLLEPETFKKGNKIIVFEVAEEDTGINITPRYEEVVEAKATPKAFKIDELTLNRLKALPKLQTVYNIAAPAGMFAVRDKTPRLFLVHEDKSDLVLAVHVCYEKSFAKDAFTVMKEVFSGNSFNKQVGLPQEIRTDSRYLYDLFKQVLASLGIRVVCTKSIPKINKLKDSMMLHLKPHRQSH